MQASVPDRQIDIFSLLGAAGRPELAFDELGRRLGQRIELSFATATGEWSQLARVVRIERSGGPRLETRRVSKSACGPTADGRIEDSSAAPRVLIYEVDGAGYGMIGEEQFDARLPYPVRAYEIKMG